MSHASLEFHVAMTMITSSSDMEQQSRELIHMLFSLCLTYRMERSADASTGSIQLQGSFGPTSMAKNTAL